VFSAEQIIHLQDFCKVTHTMGKKVTKVFLKKKSVNSTVREDSTQNGENNGSQVHHWKK
jgi:hypothetical protein